MTGAAPLLLAIALSGASFSAAQIRDDRIQALDLLRILSDKPWIAVNRWDQLPRIIQELGPNYAPPIPVDEDISKNEDEDISRVTSDKRSAVGMALNSIRRRRQPAAALGKAVKPYVDVGILSNVDSFLDNLQGHLKSFGQLPPYQRSGLPANPPTVVEAQSSGGSGGGTGIRRLYALRPLRPAGNIRSYNRRSDMQAYGAYPGANHHDPGLLWTGLGR